MDKTERSEEPIAEEFWAESHLETFFNLSADLFSIIGPDGAFKKLNPAWKKLLGWTALELHSPGASTDISEATAREGTCANNPEPTSSDGCDRPLTSTLEARDWQEHFRHQKNPQPWIKFLHPDDVAATAIAVEQCHIGQICHFENRYRHKNGQYRWLSWNVKRDENGHLYAVAKDVTLSKTLERQDTWRQSSLGDFVTNTPASLALINKIVTDIAERKRTTEDIQRHRLVVEETVAYISKLFISPDVDLNQVLERLGSVVAAKSACIFEFSKNGSQLHNTQSWCDSEISPDFARLEKLDIAEFPWFSQHISRGENIAPASLDDLPAEAAAEKRLLQERNIGSLLLVPIHSTRGTRLGCLWLEDTLKRRTWLPEDVRAVQMVSEMITCDRAWKQAEAELHRVNRTLRVLKACNQALVRATEESALLQDICRIIIEIGGYRLAWVSRQGETLVPTGAPATDNPDDGLYLALPLLSTECGIHNTSSKSENSDLDFPDPDSSEVLGTLNICAARAEVFDAEELKLLQELARDLAYGIVSLRSLNERQRTEETLRKTEAVNRGILNAIPDAMFRTSKDGIYLDFIPADDFETLMSPKDFLGKKVSEVLPSPLAQQVAHSIEKVLHAGEPDIFEYQMWLSGQMRDYEARLVVSGRDEVLAIVRDVTDRKRAIQELRESEELHRITLSNISDAVFITDDRGAFTYICPNIARIFGYSASEVYELGNVSEIIGDNAIDVKQFEKRGEIRNIEREIADKAGRRHSVLVSVKRVSIKGGTILYTCHDITSRKRAIEALSQSESKYRLLMEGASDGILLWDRTLARIEGNKRACEMLGYSSEELWRLSVMDLFIPEDLANDPLRFDELEAGRSLLKERRLRRQDGSILTVEMSIKMLDDGSIQAIARDITERKLFIAALLESEQRFRATFEQAAVGITHILPDGNLMRVNQRFCDIVGYTREELLFKSFQEITHPDDLDANLRLFDELLTQRILTYSIEKRYVRKDGTLVWVNATVSAVRNQTGVPQYALVVVEDISERKQAKRILQENEEKFRNIFEESPLGMAIVGLDYRLEKVNLRLCQMLGYAESELTAMKFNEITHPEDVEADTQLAGLMFSGEIPSYTIQKRYVKKNQGTLWAISRACAIRDRDRAALYGLVMIEDVTGRKQVEAELCQLTISLEERIADRTQALEAANQELEAFCYSVSHDLRSPLRSINGFSMALQEDYAPVLDEIGKDYLARVCAATERMGQLIDDLLSLSRVTRTQLTRQSVNLSELAKTISTDLHQSEPSRQVEFAIAENVIAIADPRLLMVVLENLLGNAWKFTSKHSKARIEFGTCLHEGKPTYFVRDDGAGFDMAYSDKLFGPFQRLHAVKEFEGTGIGLATVQRVIHRHGGRVWAIGTVQKGATFFFTL